MSEVRQCPSCGDRFRPGIEECPDCGAELVDDAPAGDEGAPSPAPEATAGDADAPAVLDLHPLSDAQRRLVGQVVTARRLRHSWQGANLVVPARLLAEAEAAVAAAVEASEPVLAEGPTVVYEVGAWPAAVQGRLAELLDGAGIAHEWDDAGDLVVAEADEEAVEALFDQIDESELLGGPDPLEVLEALHGDLARLSRDPLDERGRRRLPDHAAALAAASAPFGFEPRVWRSLVAGVGRLADDLDGLDAPDVRERASGLRESVRAWL
jgi:hypothetical protein